MTTGSVHRDVVVGGFAHSADGDRTQAAPGRSETNRAPELQPVPAPCLPSGYERSHQAEIARPLRVIALAPEERAHRAGRE